MLHMLLGCWQSGVQADRQAGRLEPGGQAGGQAVLGVRAGWVVG
jgi:hypothetical protein